MSGDIPTAEVGLAFLTYAGLLFIRVSGLAALFRYPHPLNLLATRPFRTIGEFIFFDFILLAVIGLVSSGVLLAFAIDGSPTDRYRRVKLTAGLGVGLPAVVYILGSILIVL